jgi:hypothetical protein
MLLIINYFIDGVAVVVLPGNDATAGVDDTMIVERYNS